MVIFTAKLSKQKLLAVAAAAIALIVFIIFLANRGSTTTMETAAVKLETPESRVEFLASNGYTVSQEPARTQEVMIPKEFTEVYERYNAMQVSQGFDLEKYRGKKVMQYVYLVENWTQDDDPEPVYATLLTYKDKLIGAELSRGGENGFLRPLLES